MSNKREYNKSLKMFFGFEDEYDYEFSKYPTKKIVSL